MVQMYRNRYKSYGECVKFTEKSNLQTNFVKFTGKKCEKKFSYNSNPRSNEIIL